MRTRVLVLLLVCLLAACGPDAEGEGQAVAYGAMSCSDWAGRMDDGEQWDAAEELLAQAKSVDGVEGDKAPSTSVIRQFAADLGAECERRPSDDLLAVVADALYVSNRAYYSL